jgi:hypothetical protein
MIQPTATVWYYFIADGPDGALTSGPFPGRNEADTAMNHWAERIRAATTVRLYEARTAPETDKLLSESELIPDGC